MAYVQSNTSPIGPPTGNPFMERIRIRYLTARPSRDILVAANQQVTQEWWQVRREQFDLFVSQLVEQEISSGDKDAVSKRQQALTNCSFLDITPEAIQLAERLIDQNAIPPGRSCAGMPSSTSLYKTTHSPLGSAHPAQPPFRSHCTLHPRLVELDTLSRLLPAGSVHLLILKGNRG